MKIEKIGPNWYRVCDVMFCDDHSPLFKFVKQELIEATGKVELQKVTKSHVQLKVFASKRRTKAERLARISLCPLMRGARLC